MAAVALVGTLDTKGAEFAFLAGRLRAAGASVIVVDATRRAKPSAGSDA